MNLAVADCVPRVPPWAVMGTMDCQSSDAPRRRSVGVKAWHKAALLRGSGG